MKKSILSLVIAIITLSSALAEDKKIKKDTNSISNAVAKTPVTSCEGGQVRYYRDADGDGYGDLNDSMCVCDGSVPECEGFTVPGGGAPKGYTTKGGDCNDNDPNYHDLSRWYPDVDGDGYGDYSANAIDSCGPPGPDFVTNFQDCDDNDQNVNIIYNVYYSDADGDGYGNPWVKLYNQCEPPEGYVLNDSDLCPNEYGIYSGCTNEQMNWITSKTFDINGALVSSGKIYYDEQGRPIQSQSVDIKTGDTWASQTMYDNQGRSALHSLSAPINTQSVDFIYQPDFIKKENGLTYAISDFETDPENPEAIGNYTGSLGWYYDEVNNNEDYQDVTNYPFSRTVFSTLNPGSALKTIGGNKISINGQQEEWLNGFTYTVPAAQEMYYVFGKGYFGQEGVIETSEEVITKFYKTVSVDVHDVESVIFTDGEGKTLAVARSGGNTKYPVVSVIGEQNYVDVHIPNGITNSDIQLLGNSVDYTIYNLRTEEIVNFSNVTGGNFYRVEYVGSDPIDYDYASITSSGTITTTTNTKGISYKVNYYDYALNYYDKSGRLIESTQPLGFNASAFDLTSEFPDHQLRSTYQYNASGELIATTSPDEGTANFIYREDGQIRFSQNSKQANVNEFSYTNYDDLGRPVESGVHDGPLAFSDAASRNFTLTDMELTRQEGNRVLKTGADSWGSSALATSKMISGDGYVQWRFPIANQRIMVGLSSTNASNNYNTIQYAIYTYDGLIWVFESGTNRGSFGTYNGSDLFKVERIGNVVHYKKNNNTFYTSTINTSADLLGDFALYTGNSEIENFEMGGNIIIPTNLPEYKNVSNVTHNGSTITKTSGGNTAFDAGLKTTEILQGDGALQFKAAQTNKGFMAGLSSRISYTSPEYAFIDYAIYLTASGSCLIYEHGNYMGSFGSYSTSDVFKVERTGNMVKYLKNDTVFYTSLMSSYNKDLVGAVSMRETNGSIENFMLINGLHVYKDYLNIETSGSSIKKISVIGWNGGFSSNEAITGDGFVQFKSPDHPNVYQTVIVGFSETNTDANYNTIDFGIMLHRTKYVYIFESGAQIGQFGIYEPGDVFKVVRSDVQGTIRYYKNNQLIYTSQGTSTNPLYIDSSFLYPENYIEDLALFTLTDANDVVDVDDVLDYSFCKEQHFTMYDKADINNLSTALSNSNINPNFYPRQNFVSGNVSKTWTENPETTTTWYSYDIYGRVEWVVQYIVGLGTKTIDYEYDPVKGLVTKVIYQKHVPDERFIHKYEYNLVGELEKVYTSTDDVNFTEQAAYTYYETGALKRKYVTPVSQGVDYVYNLAGRLKAINHPSLEADKDPGGDANDVFGMHIDYYDGDYKRTNTPKPIVTSPNGENRYDGNIKATRWGTRQLDGTPDQAHNGYVYTYNENKWLQEAEYGSAANNGIITISNNNDYKVSNLTYDANGNLLSLSRRNNNVGDNSMDEFTYHYDGLTNKLNHVDDTVPPSAYEDLDAQQPDNYEYNSIGQMVKDVGDDMVYTYNASGLVTNIRKENTPFEMNIYYNDRNQRVRKASTSDGNTWYETFYVRDVSGSVMAIYSGSFGAVNETLAASEYPIYGASRLGVYNRQTGESSYQFTDHLGNVRAVLQNQDITNFTDYYPFGMPMPNRNIEGNYRYKFQGQEKDPETGKEAFELRLWDSRIGRWLTTDPYGEFHSPYLGMGNNPISLVDPDGGKTDDEWMQNADGSWKKIGNKGGDEIDYYHYSIGEKAGQVARLDWSTYSLTWSAGETNFVWNLLARTDWSGPAYQGPGAPYRLNKADFEYVKSWFSQDPHVNDPFSTYLVQMVQRGEPIARQNAYNYYGEDVVNDVARMKVIGHALNIASFAQGGGGRQRSNMSYNFKGLTAKEISYIAINNTIIPKNAINLVMNPKIKADSFYKMMNPNYNGSLGNGTGFTSSNGIKWSYYPRGGTNPGGYNIKGLTTNGQYIMLRFSQ